MRVQWRSAGGAVLLVLLAAGVAAAFVSEPPPRALMVANSDTLLAAAYAQNLLHHPETIGSFQLSRLPSFFPDLALYVTLTALLPSWRDAAFGYGIVSFVALVLLAGVIVGRMSGSTWRRGGAVFLALAAIALPLEIDVNGGTGSLYYLFIPINHSGSVTLSLAALLVARRAVERRSWMLTGGVALLAALGMASDKLFFGSFVAPLVAGAIVMGWGTPWREVRRWGVVALAGVVGCAVGAVVDRMLFASILMRQPDMEIDLGAQLLRLGELVREPTVLWSIGLGVAVVLLPAAWRRDREASFWWVVAAVTVLGFLALLSLLYADPSAARYVQPVRWWGLIVLAAGALRAAPRGAPWGAGAVAALLLTSANARGHDVLRPSLVLGYRSPIAACLMDLKKRGVIHAGIAQYWDARLIEASSDWRLQVEQVVNRGEVFVWGNNPFYYTHDVVDPSQPAVFDFIVMKDLNPGDIRERFGEPDRVIPCPESEIWVYDAPGGIGRRIGSIDLAEERGGILAGSACFTHDDFNTRSGPLLSAGLTVPTAAPPHDVGTYGPYVRLRPGRWRLRLSYRLQVAGPGGEDWDVVLGGGRTVLQSGALRPGGPAAMTQDVEFTVGRDTSPLELRTFLQPGDHLAIDSLGISRAGAPAPACQP